VKKATTPECECRVIWTVYVGKTWRVSHEIVPSRLSFDPSRSTHRLRGEMRRSRDVGNMVAISFAVATKLMLATMCSCMDCRIYNTELYIREI
jgi:hypothetical protein